MQENKQKQNSVEIANIDGHKNDMRLNIESSPLILSVNNVKIGNVKGDYNKESIQINGGISKSLQPVWIFAGILFAAFNSISTNILSNYIQDKYGILTHNLRLVIVAFVFIGTMLLTSWIAIKNSK